MIVSSPPQFGQCSRSSSNTRFSSRAQLSRTGRWCAQLASHSAGCATCVGGSGPCGTTNARSLALGASTPWVAQRGSAHFAQRSERTPKRIRCSRRARTQTVQRTVCAWRGVGPLARRALQGGVARATEGRSSIARAASRCMNSSGDITRCVVPSRQGVLSLLELEHHLTRGVGLHAFFCPAPGG